MSSLVHLRPQLHHLDATTQQERNAAASGSKEAAPGSSNAARAIHMTIKTTADGDAVTTETMADRLRHVQTENWRTMRYTDENDEAAWDVYNESLFLNPQTEATSQSKDSDPATAAAEQELEGQVPRFGAKWGDKQLLEAVSGIIKPDPKPVEPEVKAEPKDQQADSSKSQADEARKPKSRARGGAAAGATRRGSRSKASTSKTTINID